MKTPTDKQIDKIVHDCIMEFTDDNCKMRPLDYVHQVIATTIRELLKELNE